MIYKEDLRNLVISQLLNNPDIISKYNIFYNGSNVIAEYKDMTRLYKEQLDRALILDIIYHYNTKNIIYLYDNEIFNGNNVNFLIVFEKNNADYIRELSDKKLYVLSKDLLINDINKGILRKSDEYYNISKEYLENNATSKITIKF